MEDLQFLQESNSPARLNEEEEVKDSIKTPEKTEDNPIKYETA